MAFTIDTLLNVSVVVTLIVEVEFPLFIKLTVPLLWVKVPPAVCVNSFEIFRVPVVEVKVPPLKTKSPNPALLVKVMVPLPPVKVPAAWEKAELLAEPASVIALVPDCVMIPL